MSEFNPFWYGSPVPLKQLNNRHDEIKAIASRIATGQSTALSGLPRTGKTSILQYLQAEEFQQTLYGEQANQLLFVNLDASRWNKEFNCNQFWREALEPIRELLGTDTSSSLYNAYQVCQKEKFSNYVVERLFKVLKKENKRLVLLIDEFDAVLHLPLETHANFFGTLRSITTSSQGALVVIIAVNVSLSRLTHETAKATGTGSAYFNFMPEITLGNLSDEATETLLSQAADRFIREDIVFIKDMAGNHPYLVQMLASHLWTLYGKPELTLKERHSGAIEQLYIEGLEILERIWKTWVLTTHQALMTVAFVQLEKLKQIFQRQGIDVDSLSKHIPGLKSELDMLKKQGIVIEDEKITGGWRVRPRIFVHFIVDKKLEEKFRAKLPPEIWTELKLLTL